MSNQLSAMCMHQQSQTKMDFSTAEPSSSHQALLNNHLNLSYFAKFPSIPIEIMHDLVSEYVNLSRKHLTSFCDNCHANNSSQQHHSNATLSDQSALLLQALKSILNEIQELNQYNVQQYLNNK